MFKNFFLDRDGVINTNGFVNRPDQFQFIQGSREALQILTDSECRAFIITNQGGIEAGFLTEATLQEIHAQMIGSVEAIGGQIDAIYYCPHLKQPCECRKPQPGLILKAIAEYNLQDSLDECCFIGDYITDWQAAQNAGIQPIAVSTGRCKQPDAVAFLKAHGIPLYENLLAAVVALAYLQEKTV